MSDPAGSWFVGGASARGAAHQRRDKPNQDAIGWLPQSGSSQAVAAAVADGHGADAHFQSQAGAELAVRSALDVLDWFLSEDQSDEAVRELPDQIVTAWQGAVQAHGDRPASGGEWVEPLADILLPYGATLVALAANAALVVALQVGDGDLYLGYPDGRIVKPLPDDGGLVGEQTYSLCALDASRRFRSAVLRAGPGTLLPDFALLCSDGISKSFSDEAAFLKVVGHYRQVMLTAAMPEVTRPLPAWLADLSRRGSGDDVTLCLAVRK